MSDNTSKKTVQEWIALLPEPVRSQVRNNYEKQGNSISDTREVRHVSDIVGGLFSWGG